MQSYSTDHIRNVVLLSHCGAGKSSLSEAMLFTSGAIPRLGRVDDGSSTSDFDPDEISARSASTFRCFHASGAEQGQCSGCPGYADFVLGRWPEWRWLTRRLLSSVRVGDRGGHELMWRWLTAEVARFVFINKMDRENADFSKVVEQVQKRFGRHCVPLAIRSGRIPVLRVWWTSIYESLQEGQEGGRSPATVEAQASRCVRS